ncbi:UNVERIFIED_CONTAM: hypothetical protein Slati_2852200, partial [Sesamum latifolium]
NPASVADKLPGGKSKSKQAEIALENSLTVDLSAVTVTRNLSRNLSANTGKKRSQPTVLERTGSEDSGGKNNQTSRTAPQKF